MGRINIKRIAIFIFILVLLSACVPDEEQIPTATSTHTPISTKVIPTSTQTPTVTPASEPTRTIAELGYKIKIGDIKCTLQQYEEVNLNIYLTECPEILYMPLNSTIKIELITPNGETFAFIGAEDILADFATGAIPYKDKAGERIVCGISFENPEENLIVVEGLTIRTGGGSGNSGGGSGSSGSGSPPPQPTPNPGG